MRPSTTRVLVALATASLLLPACLAPDWLTADDDDSGPPGDDDSSDPGDDDPGDDDTGDDDTGDDPDRIDTTDIRTQDSPEAHWWVYLAYRSILGRDPDSGGLAGYASSLLDGNDLASICLELFLSQEFADNRAHLTSIELGYWFYGELLNREPSADELLAVGKRTLGLDLHYLVAALITRAGPPAF